MISTNGYTDVSDVIIKPMSIEGLVIMRRSQGVRVIANNGCYWEEVKSGFYQPVHLLARLHSEQATSPAQFCWGYRAALSDGDACKANGTIPVHLLTNLKDYDVHLLSSNRRYQLRKCRKKVKIVAIKNKDILQEQGYEVITSSLNRTRHRSITNYDSYIKSLEAINFDNYLVLAGLIDDRLSGYLSGYAVNKTAYIMNLFVHTEALKTNIATGLTFDFIQVCRRSEEIHEVVHGLHAHQDLLLCQYKASLGFQVQHIPSRVKINWAMSKLIQFWRPNSYYILTGRG